MDIGKIGRNKHHIKALIEIDVTESREKIKNKRSKYGEKISFTSWVLKCISQAILEHKQVHALRKGKNKLVIFDNVDISIMVEKKVDGELVPLPMVIKNVNKKSINDIFNEIECIRQLNPLSGPEFLLQGFDEKIHSLFYKGAVQY